MALLDRLVSSFQIHDGTLLVVSGYDWENTLNAKDSCMLTIAGGSAGSYSGIVQETGSSVVTITFSDGSLTNQVVITEDAVATGTHTIDFSNITTVGYYEFEFWDGYEFRKITAFRAIQQST